LYEFVSNHGVHRVDSLGRFDLEGGLSGSVVGFAGIHGLEIDVAITFTLSCKKCVTVAGHLLFGLGAVVGVGGGATLGWGDTPGSAGLGLPGHSVGQTEGLGGGVGLPAPPEGEPLGGTGAIDWGVDGSKGGSGGAGHVGPTIGAAAYYRRGVNCKACSSLLKPPLLTEVELVIELAKCIIESARLAAVELGVGK
jgi:hypothetical protein